MFTDSGIFSLRNILEVSLFFIIGIPIIYLLKKYFERRNRNTTNQKETGKNQ
jgi:hypothetical protein